MKTHLVVTAIFATATLAPAIGHASDEASLVLKHSNIEKFTDFTDPLDDDEETWSIFVREAARSLGSEVDRVLRGGTLEITVLDMNRAGEIQPWRNRTFSDVRYLEPIHHPHAEIAYVVRDSEGSIALEGKARVREMNFMFTLDPRRNDTMFFHEIEMLRLWIRGDLRKAVAARSDDPFRSYKPDAS